MCFFLLSMCVVVGFPGFCNLECECSATMYFSFFGTNEGQGV